MRTTLQTQRVLEALLGNQELYGLQACEETNLPAGTVYPILARLEQAGWIESHWEAPAKHVAEGRPRRRYYRLTREGAQRAREAVSVTYRAGRRVQPEPS